jgi:hypothetical protein
VAAQIPPSGCAGHSINVAARAKRATRGIGVNVTFTWDPDMSFDARARIETAVGVLMELCGWEANKALSRLIFAADRADAPVETVAEAILALGPEHPPR